jgi:hypothetical protein
MPCAFCDLGTCVNPAHIVRLFDVRDAALAEEDSDLPPLIDEEPSTVPLFDISGRSVRDLVNRRPRIELPPPLSEEARLDRLRREEDAETERFFREQPELLRGCLYHASPSLSPVPKSIHFVWLGGPLGESRFKKICDWAGKNKGWRVNLWVDPGLLTSNTIRKARQRLTQLQCLPSPGVTHRLIAQNCAHATVEAALPPKQLKPLEIKLTKHLLYKTEEDFHLNLVLSLIQTKGTALARQLGKELWQSASENVTQAANEFSKLQSLGIGVNDVRLFVTPEVLKWYRWETRLGWTNYGAASDLARLCILHQCGGVYLDVDLDCLAPLGDLRCADNLARIGPLIDDETVKAFKDKLPEVPGYFLLASSKLQARVRKLVEQLEGNVAHSFNNNVIACQPRSAFIQRYLLQCLKNYTTGVDKHGFIDLHWCGDAEDIKLTTVSTTGPHVIEGLLTAIPGMCKSCKLDKGHALRAATKFPAGIIGWLTDISGTRDWI